MRNFKLSVDISDIYKEVKGQLNKEYSLPFFLIFLEAENPDDACYVLVQRITKYILENNNSVDNMIVCRKIKKYIRIYKIQQL